jgi:tRNA pseudouridine38-40 synthase
MVEEAKTPVWKFRLTVAYDGTNYSGWQVQKIGLGVQQCVEEAFRKIFPSVARIHGSSRTDTGVHALGMVAHVEIPKAEFRMPVAKLALAVNAHLPSDIRVMKATRCAAGFHARFDATGKQYRYQIWNARAMNPMLNNQAWHVPRKLDIGAMRAGAPHFVGRKDFKSLAATREYEMENTVRTLHRCELRRAGELLTVVIEGDGFLYKMCRAIVGTLVQVGAGRLSVEEIPRILEAKDRKACGMTAPAKGLVLQRVFYARGGKAR